ncbi:MAG: hypothetical protein GY698_24575 [Actinomycetia bacterium]|nr:hypothetical protein [Actinomycetes bacterium]
MTTQCDDRRLYGVPGAEHMYRDAAEVWETDIEPFLGFTDGAISTWEVEVWSVQPSDQFMPPADLVLECISEWAGDDCGLEGFAESVGEAVADPAVVYMVRRLLSAIAERTHYWVANEKVDDMFVTIDSDGRPLLNGEQMYVPTKPGLIGGPDTGRLGL